MDVSWQPFSTLLKGVIDNRGRTAPTAEVGIPLIATNCVNTNELFPAYEKVRYVSQATYETWFRGHPSPGDILFVTKGSPGRTALVPDPVDFCIAQDMVALRADETKVYPPFLFALLRSRDVRAAIENLHVGTLIPHFKKGDFDKLILPIPNTKSQIFIGDLYLEISKKIELNRKMNATLDELARTVFRSWFVDFDPVHAKAEGRESFGMDAETAALFPDHFTDSELGPIPEGWPIHSLAEVADLRWGDTNTTKRSYVAEGWVAYSATGPDGYLPYFDYKHTGVVLSAIGANCGSTWLARGKWSCIKNTIRFWSVKPGVSTEYLYFATSWPEFWPRRGSAQPFISQTDARQLKVLVPSKDVNREFFKIVDPLLTLVETNRTESRTLAELRDTLLPELISGRIRVPEAEKLVGETV